jgi:hypothetical protein
MNNPLRLLITLAIPTAGLFLTACATEEVQGTRQTGLERRQDRMDSRTSARQDRWAERGAREDARAKARFDSW